MKETAKYIRSNLSCLNYSTLSQIKIEITRTLITEKLEVIPSQDNSESAKLLGRTVHSTNVFDLSLSFEANKKRFYDYLRKNYKIRSDFNRIYRASELFAVNSFRYNGHDRYKVKKVSEDIIFELIRLLNKIILNTDEDLFEIDSNSITKLANFEEVYIRNIKLRIKCFRAGRIDISGLGKREKSFMLRLCNKNKAGYLLPNRDYKEKQ